MPVKAKPVEYVKICTLYGAGFYYIPGTDTCIKIGGYVRVQVDLGGGGGGVVDGSGPQGGQARFTRDLANEINYRVRGVATFDARTQTEYGTLRSYFRAGWENTTPAATGGGSTASPFWDRAFIQFAGFTVGRAQSFYDGFTFGGAYSYLNVRVGGDTGATGQNLWAYTVQFGNGVSYSVSLEDPATKRGSVIDISLLQLHRQRGSAVGRRASRSNRVRRNRSVRLPGSGHHHQPARRPGLGLCRCVDRDPRGERRLLSRNRPNKRQQRASGRQVWLGVLGLRPVEPAGRRHHRRQLRRWPAARPATPPTPTSGSSTTTPTAGRWDGWLTASSAPAPTSN